MKSKNWSTETFEMMIQPYFKNWTSSTLLKILHEGLVQMIFLFNWVIFRFHVNIPGFY